MSQQPIPPSTVSSETRPLNPAELEAAREAERQQQRILWTVGIVILLIIAGVIAAIIALIQPSTDAARVRDIFIIVLAAQTLLIGFVLILLVIQLARLINLLQNEIKPILESTKETAGTLRGTTVFLSEHLSEPVIRLNEYLAGLQRLLELLNVGRNRRP